MKIHCVYTCLCKRTRNIDIKSWLQRCKATTKRRILYYLFIRNDVIVQRFQRPQTVHQVMSVVWFQTQWGVIQSQYRNAWRSSHIVHVSKFRNTVVVKKNNLEFSERCPKLVARQFCNLLTKGIRFSLLKKSNVKYIGVANLQQQTAFKSTVGRHSGSLLLILVVEAGWHKQKYNLSS